MKFVKLWRLIKSGLYKGMPCSYSYLFFLLSLSLSRTILAVARVTFFMFVLKQGRNSAFCIGTVGRNVEGLMAYA